MPCIAFVALGPFAVPHVLVVLDTFAKIHCFVLNRHTRLVKRLVERLVDRLVERLVECEFTASTIHDHVHLRLGFTALIGRGIPLLRLWAFGLLEMRPRQQRPWEAGV